MNEVHPYIRLIGNNNSLKISLCLNRLQSLDLYRVPLLLPNKKSQSLLITVLERGVIAIIEGKKSYCSCISNNRRIKVSNSEKYCFSFELLPILAEFSSTYFPIKTPHFY